MHEILTIQTGPRANFLCTHFWNAQLSYQTYPPAPPVPINHDIHFRSGLSADGTETYLPRTLIYDLKPAFGTLARINALDTALSSSAADSELWNGPVKKVPHPSSANVQPSPYAEALESGSADEVKPTVATTRYFADFASTFYHPRSLRPLTPPYPTTGTGTNTSTTASSSSSSSSSGSGNRPSPQFSTSAHGAALFAATDHATEILDSDVRPWMEEADAPQAISFFGSTHDAWGGFAARYMEQLRDEFPKLSVWFYACDDADGGETGASGTGTAQAKSRLRERAANAALGIGEIGALASVYVPLGVAAKLPGWVMLDRGSQWHVGGLMAAGVESLGLAGRMTADGAAAGRRVPVLGDWEDVLCDGGRRRVVGLKMGIGRKDGGDGKKKKKAGDARMRETEAELLGEDQDPEQRDEELDKGLELNLSPLEVVGGPGRGRVLGRRNKTFARVDGWRDDQVAAKGPRQDIRMQRNGPIIEEYDAQPAFPLLPTFPSIFTQSEGRQSLPIHTSLSTSSSIATWLRNMQRSIAGGVGLPGELASEERESLSNNLAEMAEAYVEGWESGSDSEDE